MPCPELIANVGRYRVTNSAANFLIGVRLMQRAANFATGIRRRV
jgi:hypothetical protein